MADASVETTASGRCLVAKVSGAMDFQTEPVLRARFSELIAQSDRCIVLDLSGVTFCDSAGLSVLIRAWQQPGAGGTVLACVPESLRLILRTTAMDRVLRVFDTVAEAEAAFDV
ncbi:STAS domain-containing protein [Streptomyces chartreusis]|uniref:STAS domain-containing protein n=1 Tax=Streptomyces chartreusis TaxID=1969 RepID=UPI003667EA7D